MRLAKPLAGAFANWAGHRKVGLKYDDLIIEENETAQKVRCHSGAEDWNKGRAR